MEKPCLSVHMLGLKYPRILMKYGARHFIVNVVGRIQFQLITVNAIIVPTSLPYLFYFYALSSLRVPRFVLTVP